jgi:hypothetical protein
MSSITDRPKRRIPASFEGYLRTVGVKELDEAQQCTGCWRDGGRWRDKTNVYCEPCMRYQFGYDQAEESVARRLIAAVVAGALDADTPVDVEIVRDAINDAIDEHIAVVAANDARIERRLAR